ncbi:MAG TPA: hypothetical protein PKI21_12190 [Nitrospira sp.]|nr:hypothetical protein [Nitrospira sp.]HPV83104.1 hypothetical protein [Nitrospira sp.]
MHPIHPMVVHFPIAFLLASLLFDLIALRWRGQECRATSLSLLALGVLAALVALLTGHLAEEAVEHSGTIPKQAIETHEELAFAAFWVFAGLLGVKLLSYWGWMRERALLVLFIGVGGSVLLLVASYYGGDLVYRYGAGVLPR